jgi:type I restriction enzyme S subunit
MKQGWEMKTIGDVCKSASSNISQNKLANDEGIYPIFGASGLIKNVSFYHRDKPYLSIVKDGSGVGRVTKMEAFTSVIGTLQYLLPNEDIDLDYLNYTLMSVDFKKYVAGAAIPHIYFKDYKNEPFLWMPLKEQQRIVTILDEAFTAIDKAKANTEQNLKNAKELFESELQRVFSEKGDGWEEKRLGDVCEYDKTSYKSDDLPYVGLEDIQSNSGKLIGPLTARSVKSLTFHFNKEHVLYGRLRPYLNKVLLPDFEGHCSTEIFPIKPKKEILDRSYLFRWLISKETMTKINATWTGATLPRANMNLVLDFKINLPSLEDQQTIVSKLDALREQTKKLEAVYTQKLQDLEELKKSVLQKAFTGELVEP